MKNSASSRSRPRSSRKVCAVCEVMEILYLPDILKTYSYNAATASETLELASI